MNEIHKRKKKMKRERGGEGKIPINLSKHLIKFNILKVFFFNGAFIYIQMEVFLSIQILKLGRVKISFILIVQLKCI